MPHSEIHGSKLIRSSPRLFAAYHVLHRLCMPRHPPIALKTLDRSHCQCPPGSLPTVLARKTSFSRSVRWPAVKPPIICRGLSVPGDEPPVAVEPEQIFSSRCRQNRRMAHGRPEPSRTSGVAPPRDRKIDVRHDTMYLPFPIMIPDMHCLRPISTEAMP